MKSYIDQGFESMRESLKHLETIINDKFEAQDKIRVKNSEILNGRLDRMNEFREQLSLERGNYPTREICDGRMKPLEAKSSFLEGREAAFIGIFGILTFLVPILLRILWP